MTRTNKRKTGLKAKRGESSSGKAHAILTFELPEAEEFLELAIQARKWREVVRDFILELMMWQDTAKTEAERSAYRSAKSILRYSMADAGLTICTRDQQEEIHKRNAKQYSRHLDAMIKKGKELLKEEELIENDLGGAEAN